MKFTFKNREMLIGVIWFIPTLLILIFMKSLVGESKVSVDVEATFFPNVVLALQLFLSFILISHSIKFNLENKKVNIETATIQENSNLRVMIIAFLILIYLFLTYLAGLIISSFLFLFFMMFFLGYRKVFKLVLICAFIVGMLYFIFNYILIIKLPGGVLFS